MNKHSIGLKGQQQLQEYFSKYFGKVCRLKSENQGNLPSGTEVIPYGIPIVGNWGSLGTDTTNISVAVSYYSYNRSTATVAVRISDLELVEEQPLLNSTTKAELTKMKETLKQQLEVVEMKLKFIKESGAKEFNEKEFKAYQTLELVNKPGMSNLEKTQLIAKLF